MTLSQVISALQAFQNELGDIDCNIRLASDQGCPIREIVCDNDCDCIAIVAEV